jgi:hypothetical protein
LYSTISSTFYEPIRDNIRNKLFNDIVDQPANIPFANAFEATMLSLLGEDKTTLREGAITLIKNDPAMRAFEQKRLLI